MPTSVYSGSASIGTTEFSLPNNAAYSAGSPITTLVSMQWWIDLNAMAAGDTFTIRIYRAVAGGTARLVDAIVLTGVQATPVYPLPPLILGDAWDVTVQGSTSRSIRWAGLTP